MAAITITVEKIEQALEHPQWHTLLAKALEIAILFSSLKEEIARREQAVNQCQQSIEHLVARIDLCANEDCQNKPESYRNQLKKCAQCQVVAYCCETCELADREIHQLVCKK